MYRTLKYLTISIGAILFLIIIGTVVILTYYNPLEYIFVTGPLNHFKYVEQHYAENFTLDNNTNSYNYSGEYFISGNCEGGMPLLNPTGEYLLLYRAKEGQTTSGEPMPFTYFQVYKKNGNKSFKLISTSPESWRIFDFKYYNWSGNIIQAVSGDTGTSQYTITGEYIPFTD